MRLRFAVLSALATGVLLAPLAGATPTPQITDPTGDAIGGQPAHDIVSVTFHTEGTGAGREFVVTFELAGPPSTGPGTSYAAWATDTPCGMFFMSVGWAAVHSGPSTAPGPRTDGSWWLCGGPGESSTPGAGQFQPQLSVDGNTLSLAVPVATLPSEFEGGTFAGLESSTAPAEPLFGVSPYGRAGVFDNARSTQTYTFGS